jgi:hydroxypyruvate isomerase
MSLRLRHSAADWCFLTAAMDPRQYYRDLAEAGFTAVEMVRAEHRELARQAGLVLLTHSAAGIEQGLNHRSHHAELLPKIRQAIQEASQAGIRHVIVFSGMRLGLSEDAGITGCIEGLRQLAGDAERARVGLLLEVLSEVVHPDHHCSRMSFAREVVTQVASPAVRILYDLFHATHMGDDVIREATTHLELIGHLHVAALSNRSRPRAGELPDYPRITQALCQAGYDGWWGHEFLPTGEVMQELRQSLAHLDQPSAAAPGGTGPAGRQAQG